MQESVPPAMPQAPGQGHPKRGLALPERCSEAGYRPRSQEPARELGTVHTTSRADDAQYRQYPYVIRFDNPHLDCIYTDGGSKHQVRGQPSDEDRGTFIHGEIQIDRPEPTHGARAHGRAGQRDTKETTGQTDRRHPRCIIQALGPVQGYSTHGKI